MTAPIDASMYLNMIDSIGTFPTRESLSQTVTAAYTQAEDFEKPVDLSNYYAPNSEATDIWTEVANNLKASEETLNNVMIAALENGMGVQDAVNINCAMQAYKANAYVAKSTFELKI